MQEIEQETRWKFDGGSSNPGYNASLVSHLPKVGSENYFDVLLHLRLDRIRQHISENSCLLDVCCSTGIHLQSFCSIVGNAIGVDFSHNFIKDAIFRAKEQRCQNVCYLEANAKKIPLKSETVDFTYSLSSLYYIPEVCGVIKEICRVLKPGGKCLLDLGNLNSLNTLICNQQPELAKPFHIPVNEMKKMILMSGLTIVEHSAFQILPLWGGKTKITALISHPRIIKIMQRKILGKMIDEWISNLPLFKTFAFRHIFICEKIL